MYKFDSELENEIKILKEYGISDWSNLWAIQLVAAHYGLYKLSSFVEAITEFYQYVE